MIYTGDKLKIKNNTLVFNKKKTKINEFNYNEQIVQLELGDKVKKLSRMSFAGCRSIEAVKFNNALEEIEYGAFYNCVSLSSAELPITLKALGDGVFKDCRSLKKVVLPELRVLPENLFKGCFALEEVVIPDSVEVIEQGCFQSCTSLKKITFGKNLREIKAYAFKRCQSLESVVFPESLKIIGDKAFEDDKNLKIVKFNSDLSYLGKAVFYNRVYDEYKIKGTAFSSSFAAKEDMENCITITIPTTVEYLALGFEGVLPFAYINRNKTCPNHVLALEKEKAKVFMSSAYYSYSDDSDYVIKNNEFDFLKYDNQLEKAEEAEKPFVAAFRLAYPKELSEAKKNEYFNLLKGSEKDVAIFSVEVNDENVLSYLLENFSFDTEFCAALYSLCAKKGYSNLQETVSVKKEKTALTETENMLNDLLLV